MRRDKRRSMEDQICNHYKYGFCKFQDHCQKKHVEGECNALSTCKSKVCQMRHPKVCKRLALEKFCKFGDECAYSHRIDKSDEAQKQLSARNEFEIKLLKDEVKDLKLEIKKLTALTHDLCQKPEEISDGEKYTEESAIQKVPVRSKFKCDMCECSFKKEITLRKHKNTKHIEPVRADKELNAPKDMALEAESSIDLKIKTKDTKKVVDNEK